VSGRTNGLGAQYVSSLERFLRSGDESALSLAYELGRRAMKDGLGVLDVSAMHQQAVDGIIASAPPSEQPRFLRAAGTFFTELLSPFEMSLRGYRAANEELRRLNESLGKQKEAVESVNRELESFSYSVSHDLRAPLRAIDGFSQILLEDFAGVLGEEGRDHLLHVREATAHMAQLIEDLLALARVTRTEIHPVQVDLSGLARRITERLQASSPGRRVRVCVMDGVVGDGDPGLLTIVLENLLGNAWKFTSKRENAEIAFGREDHDGTPTYCVRDNGAGFNMANAGKLFGAFQRFHSASQFEGTGIGLATVQRIIHRHGGRVWAKAKVDAGATFFFTLGKQRTS